MTGRLDERATHIFTGVGRMALGTSLTSDALTAIGLAGFLMNASGYPRVGFTIAAFLLLIALVVFQHLLAMRRFARVARWRFPIQAFAGAVILALDFTGAWASPGLAAYPLTALGVTGSLFVLVTVRPARDVLIATGVLAAVLMVALSINVDESTALAPRIAFVTAVIIPPLSGVLAVRAFRAIVQRHSEVAQTQSATASDSSVGMLASDELARLDLDAERLLENVASGSYELPLDAETAGNASALATQLRLHLIEDRRQTWLHHAITESTVLDPVTEIADPEGLAAYMPAHTRDGLFSAIWMLVGHATHPASALRIGIDRVEEARPGTQTLAIELEAAGVQRRHVDPATWQAIAKVGGYRETGRTGTFRVEIDCLLDPAADR